MKRIFITTMLAAGFLLQHFDSQANGLVISNLTRNAAAQTVTFNIQWFNSWRVDSSGAPYNWDAAWVFVKFRQCGAASTTPWTHAKIDPLAVTNAFSDLEPHSHTGTYWNDSLGVMLRRDANGIFPNQAASTITLTLNNIPTTGSYDVKVFGIETVYVPQGAYELGYSDYYYSLNDGLGNPLPITSENAVTINRDNSNATIHNNIVYNVPAAYPKGYDPFYIMKYEISEGQYAAFMNTIATPAQLNRWPGNYNLYRNRLNNNGAAPDIYVAEREDRAQNYISLWDLFSYLDWSGLRPMTELEFEKACRGEAPSVMNEYAWGTNSIVQAQTISTSPEDGTETIFSPAGANCTYNNYLFGGGDGGRGPLRVGIFATPTSNTRIGTGATYYGVMEMSGNLWERCIDINNIAVPFTGVYGDGQLTTAGLFDVADWTGKYHCFRGGNFYNNNATCFVSRRQYSNYAPTNTHTTRSYNYGGRGVR